MRNWLALQLVAFAVTVVTGTGAERGHVAAPGGKGVEKPELVVDLGRGLAMELVLVRPGSFDMGIDGERGGFGGPRHKVIIKYPFYMGKYEVTQEQWQAVTGENPSNFKGPKNPVEGISWEGIRGFLAKLRVRTGRTFALPTEAEWEYACRAGSTTMYTFGDDDAPAGEYAWHRGNSGGAFGTTHPVGQKKPNQWGLFDMYGNVWEWCEDFWHPRYEGAPTDGSAWLKGDRNQRVLRGGGWNDPPYSCHSTIRMSCGASSTGGGYHIGCRVVLRDF